MKGQYIKIRNPMPVEEYGRSITQVPSELASSDSTGPAPVVVSGGGLGASAPTGQKHLIPFKLHIHDDDVRHPHGRELGTVWVEIPHDEITARVKPDIPGQHWEYVAQEEKYAAESICADLSCSIDIACFILLPQNMKVSESAP